jgi:CRP/FNR family transcriptional regulator
MDEDLKYWYLRDHKLFRTLSFKQMKQLCIIMGFKEAKKERGYLFSSSDVPRICVEKKEISKSWLLMKPEMKQLKTLLKGDLFGELTLEADGESNEYAKVLSDDVACSFVLILKRYY